MDGDVDHYAVLGLPSGKDGAKLSEKEIKKAYLSKLLESHPDKRPDDPNAHHNFLNLHSSYKILMDKKSRQSFHQREEEKMIKRRKTRKSQQQHSSSKQRRKTDVDEREQAARAAHSAAKAACDMEEYIRTSNEQLIAEIKRDAAAAAASRAPPAAPASTSNKGGAAKEAPASTHCPCGHCQGGHWLDREFSSNFEEHQNSLLAKLRRAAKRHK